MNKLYSNLGLCQKAGKLKNGSFQVEDAIKSNKACFVIIAKDSGNNTKKKFSDMCKFYNIKYVEAGSVDEISRAVGKELRAIVCITDFNLSKMVEKSLNI